MAVQVAASELGAHVGRRVRFVIQGELQLSVQEIRAARLEAGRVRLTLAGCGYVFARQDPGPEYIEWSPGDRVAWILESTHNTH